LFINFLIIQNHVKFHILYPLNMCDLLYFKLPAFFSFLKFIVIF